MVSKGLFLKSQRPQAQAEGKEANLSTSASGKGGLSRAAVGFVEISFCGGLWSLRTAETASDIGKYRENLYGSTSQRRIF
jgi:hypothetical protein